MFVSCFSLQVLSPLSDSILAEKTVTVLDDKVKEVFYANLKTASSQYIKVLHSTLTGCKLFTFSSWVASFFYKKIEDDKK